ncbi:MAG TPA: T9SS type A sorting domain-containing protein [Parafilimonas sp.]|nr:T9SS type A sorting domain-containing protein [Parafilimonas sp.]
MKKILLLTVLLVISYNLFAFTTQGVWRWRKDDGSETTATWRADQNTPITVANLDSIIRLRIELYNNGSGGLLDGALFEDSSNEAGSTWQQITGTAGTNAFVLAGTSPNVTDLEPTTHQLSGQPDPYVFVAGAEVVSSESLPAQTLNAGETSEFEYAIKPTENLKPNVTYYFRVDAATYLIGYAFPSLTTAGVLPVSLANFTVEQDKNRVLISWKTAMEQNNSHFDIERSTDGFRFSKLATVQGSGTSVVAHTYTAHDNSPYNGVNYYRIKQYDTDGKFAISGVRSLSMSGRQAIGKIYPNPSHGDINFILQNNSGGAVTATLTNLAGKVVHREIIETNTGAGSYKLNLKTKPAAGVYILQLKGDSVTENIKISIE